MSTADGAPSPSLSAATAASAPASKRKRSISNTSPQVNGDTARLGANGGPAAATGLSQTLDDVLAVLKSHDTMPSLFDLPLAQQPPSATISDKVRDQAYTCLEELLEDVEGACSDVVAATKAPEHAPNGFIYSHHGSAEQLKAITSTLAVRKLLREFIAREQQRRNLSRSKVQEGSRKNDADRPATPGTAIASAVGSISISDGLAEGRAVLTMFGNAQGPKQLFSSLQTVQKVGTKDVGVSARFDASVEVAVPLNEYSLPKVISTTKIIPAPEDPTSGKTRAPTFGEVFAPPATLPMLYPPKLTKYSSSRGSSSNPWVPHDSASKSSRRSGYFTTQSQSTGQWLGYGGVDPPPESLSPNAKRKQRDRALSTGEVQPPVSKEQLAVAQQARVDALFRAAYSSFAPSRDDAIAVIPEETKNRLWWHKVGEKKYLDSFVIDPALADLQPGEMPADTDDAEGADEIKMFKEAVEIFEPEANPFARDEARVKEQKDVDEVLKEISELLETLHSHQQIRNSQLQPAPRASISSHTSSLPHSSGGPNTPSAAEIDVYNILKSQLALMISMLPPYAVAKLNADKLADLNISRNVIIETPDYRGVLEEDQVSRLAKQTALSAAVGSTPVPRMTPSASQSYGAAASQYNRSFTPAAVPNINGTRPVVPGQQSYYPQQQPPSRAPAVQYNRSSYGAQYGTPGGYTASQRPTYQQPYAQATPRPTYAPATPQSHYQQRPSAAGYPMSHQYYQTPQPGAQGRSYQQANPSYYQAPAYTNGQNRYAYHPAPAQHSQSPALRTASPLKSVATPVSQPQHQYAVGTRAQYPPSVPSTVPSAPGLQPQPQPPQQQRQYYSPHPAPPAHSQYAHAPNMAVANPVTASLGPSGFHTSMSAEQQQMMMDRQRAQLNAMQQGQGQMLVMQGNRSASTPSSIPGIRQGSGTPQPPPGGMGYAPPQPQPQMQAVNGAMGMVA